tara:strand:+ start:186 stop:485 length:300 start_codon:yes stop_codon:yes gene_type:complete
MIHSQLTEALLNLRPGAQFSIYADDSSQIVIHDDTVLPSDSDLLAECEKLASRQVIINKIIELEALETPRRLAESILTDEGKAWLTSNRDKIATERGKL